MQPRSTLGRFLVASSLMRTGYAVSKSVTYCGLALVQAAGGLTGTPLHGAVGPVMGALHLLAWVSVAVCVLRGLPVIIHGLRAYWSVPGTPETAPS